MNRSEVISRVLAPFNYAADTEFTVETIVPELDKPLGEFFDSMEFYSFIIDVETEFDVEGIQEHQEETLGDKRFTLNDVISYLEKTV